jgi:hypothetical protein
LETTRDMTGLQFSEESSREMTGVGGGESTSSTPMGLMGTVVATTMLAPNLNCQHLVQE